MADFLFFLENGGQLIGQADLTRIGLANLFPVQPAARPVTGPHPSPSGKPGIVFGVSDCRRRVGYFPEEQTWHQCKDYWIGWQGEQPPGPEDLKRPKQLDGMPVTLADGRQWLVPQIRLQQGGTHLPVVVARNTMTGEIEGSLVAGRGSAGVDYQRLWDRCVAVFEAMIGADENGGFSVEDGFDLCVDLLSLNYRVNANIVSVLKLLTNEHIKEVLAVAVDLDAFVEYAKDVSKKNESPCGS